MPRRLLPAAGVRGGRRGRLPGGHRGPHIGRATAELFGKDAYREYLELHGLSVQLTEALAEYWHARVRSELGIGGDESLEDMLKVNITGCRYSFGYPACPNLEDQVHL